MANWESGIVYSGFNAEEHVDKHIAGREGGREGVSTSIKSEYDVVGIKVDRIPTVQAEITTYITQIKTQIDKLQPDAISSSAYRGGQERIVEGAVKDYIDKVKTYCMNLISQLEAFNDKLADVTAAWNQGTGRIAEAVNTSNAAFSEGTEYTRQR